MSNSHKGGRNYDGSQRLGNGSSRPNKRDEAVFSLSKKRSGGLDLADFDGEFLFDTIVMALKEDCAFMISSVYGGRAIRVKLFGDGKSAAGEADTINELREVLTNARKVLGYGTDNSEDAHS